MGRRWICLGLMLATAAHGAPQLTVEHVTDIEFPTDITHAPGDFQRLFVTSKSGVITVITDGVVQPTPFLDLTSVAESDGGEQGLLGLAFHPDYETNGYFYVYYTRDDDPSTQENETIVERYEVTADPEVADPGSAATVLIIAQPTRSHNGGWLGFDPDGLLYVSVGDGGGQEDPYDNAQNIDTLLGSILRIDVDGDDFPADPDRNYAIPADNPFVAGVGADEIWVYGLRNPWRCTIDPVTGDLYIGDVGNSLREELDYVAGGSPGGLNFGWDCMEATLCTGETACVCGDLGLVHPMFEFAHNPAAGNVIIAGVVYRGTEIPDLAGSYIFANMFSPAWRLDHTGGVVDELAEILLNAPGLLRIVSFGEDAAGEIYLCDKSGGAGGLGQIYKIVVDTDCNANSTPDDQDIATGTSDDCDADGVPDECQLTDGSAEDCNGNETLDACEIEVRRGRRPQRQRRPRRVRPRLQRQRHARRPRHLRRHQRRRQSQRPARRVRVHLGPRQRPQCRHQRLPGAAHRLGPQPRPPRRLRRRRRGRHR